MTVASNNTVDGYLNGVLEFTANTTVMDISSDNILGFFLDNTIGGGIGEWSPGDIAGARIYSGVLTQAQVTELDDDLTPAGATPTGVPEPASLVMLASGLVA